VLFGVVVLALGAVALVRESHQAWVGHGREQSPLAYPSLWLLGGPQIEPLRELADRVERLVPLDATILVETAYPDPERHYVEMWVAWLLPRQRVVPARLGAPAGRPAYRLIVPPQPTGPADDEVLRTDAGALVRIDPPLAGSRAP
jgi:hypothetical protein